MSDLVSFISTQLKKNPICAGLLWLIENGLFVVKSLTITPIKWSIKNIIVGPIQYLIITIPGSAPVKLIKYWSWVGYTFITFIPNFLSSISEDLYVMRVLAQRKLRRMWLDFIVYIKLNTNAMQRVRALGEAMYYLEFTGWSDFSAIDALQYSFWWDPGTWLDTTRITFFNNLEWYRLWLHEVRQAGIVRPLIRLKRNLHQIFLIIYNLTVGGFIDLATFLIHCMSYPTDIWFEGIPALIDRVSNFIEDASDFPLMYHSAQFYGVVVPICLGLYIGYKIHRSYWDQQYPVGILKQKYNGKTTSKGKLTWFERQVRKITKHRYYPIIVKAFCYYGIFTWVYLWIERWFVNGPILGIGAADGSHYRMVPSFDRSLGDPYAHEYHQDIPYNTYWGKKGVTKEWT